MAHPLVENLDYVFFVYGLSFVVLAAACLPLIRQQALGLPWRWLAAFGLLHGLNEWFDLLALDLLRDTPTTIVRLVILAGSYLALAGFACRSLTPRHACRLLPLILGLGLLGAFDGLNGWNAGLRHALGLPGALGSAWVLATRANVQGRIPLRLCAVALGLYGLASGLVVPAASFPPSSWFSQADFLALTGIPIQAVRGLLALIAGASLWWLVRGPLLATPHLRAARSIATPLLLAGALLVLGLVATIRLGRQAQDDLVRHQTDHLLSSQTILANELAETQALCSLLVSSPAIATWMAQPGTPAGQAALDAVLDRYQDILPPGSICYALDLSGTVIASSNRRAADSLIGRSFAFRPYFTEALAGRPGSLCALGTITKVLGFYASRPVCDGSGQVRLVLVIKKGLDALDDLLGLSDSLYLCDPDSVVAFANRPEHALHALHDLDDRTRAALIASQRFGPGPFPRLPIPEHGVVASQPAPPPLTGWTLITIAPSSSIARIRLLAIGLTALLLLTVLAGFAWAEAGRLEARLAHEAEHRYRAMFADNGMPMLLIHPTTGRILDANRAAAEFYGAPLEDLRTRSILDINTLPGPEVVRLMSEVPSGTTRCFRFRHRTQRGERDVEVHTIRMRPAGEEVLYSIVLDLTERLRAEAALESAKAAAEAGNRAKSQFLANMSHEIRTPMNGVMGMLELLLRSELPAAQADLARTAFDSSQALLTVLNDVLDFSKIEAGRLELEAVAFDLSDLVYGVVDLFRPRFAGGPVELLVDLPPDLPRRLRGDPGRLRQILANLVGNAAKFTSRGHVLIEVRADARDDGRVAVRLRIADTGIGIPADRRQQLFTPFTQGDASTTRRFGGTGLGLAICKRLVDLMAGRITVESEVGHGTCFTVDLALPAMPGQPVVGIDPHLLAGRQVLVVDDLALNRSIIVRQLAAFGARCVEASSGPGALARLTDGGGTWAAAVIDLAMPDMDGLDLARHLQAIPAAARLPLVLLSSADDAAGPDAVRQAGFAGLLIKPVPGEVLARMLTTAIAGEANGQLLTRHAIVEGSAARSSGPIAVIPGASVLLVEDNPVNRRLATLLLERLGATVVTAGDGQEALDLLAASRFDAVFIDCLMPVMDGYEATRELRRREGDGCRTPVIALTASALAGDRDLCLSAGMDDYLAKPIRERDLAQALHRWWRPAGGPA